MPITFGSKVKLDTRYSFGMPVKEEFQITDKIPAEILQDINATECVSTGTGAYAGMINNYTLKTTNEELWGTHVTLSAETGTRIGRDNIIPAVAANPTRSSMNFLTIPFYDENGDIAKYFGVGLKSIYYSSANNYVEGSLFFGWSANGDFDDTLHSVTDTITAGLRWDYVNRNDYVLTNVQVIENVAFEGPGLHCPDSTEYKDLALLITIGCANSTHNPTGTQPYYIDWDIRATDGAYLFQAPYSINNIERCYILPLGQVNYLGSMVTGGGEQAQLFVNEASEEVGPPSEPGGYEPHEFDETSDTVILSNIPTVGMSTGGFINVYNPTLGELSGIAEEILPKLDFQRPTPISTGLGIADAIIDGFNSVATWLANVPSMIQNLQMSKMMDYVIDCHVIPVTVHTGNHDYIKVGWKTLTKSAAKVNGDYEIVDGGDLSIDEYFRGFADYLTTARLFIPFVGYVSMQPEWFNNALLNLTYYFNVIDGSFVAMLRGIARTDGHLKSTTLLGQWGGSACVHFPITGTNYANMMSGAIGGAAGVIAAAGTGSLAGVATSAIAAMGARGTVEQSNSYSASSSMLSHKRAFVQIERPVSSYSMNYQHEIGIPSNIATSIGSASGFVRSDDVHLDGIPCTDAERQMIQAALREGIIV